MPFFSQNIWVTHNVCAFQSVRHHCRLLLKKYLKYNGLYIEVLHVFTDGATAQYKCATAFKNQSDLQWENMYVVRGMSTEVSTILTLPYIYFLTSFF